MTVQELLAEEIERTENWQAGRLVATSGARRAEDPQEASVPSPAAEAARDAEPGCDIYRLGPPPGKWDLLTIPLIGGGFFGAVFGVLWLISAGASGGKIGSTLGASLGMTFCWVVALLFFAWRDRWRIFEVRIARSGALRFVSAARETAVWPDDVLQLVRYEHYRDHDLVNFRVIHRGGAGLTIGGRQVGDVFSRLRALNPEARIDRREINPDPD